MRKEREGGRERDGFHRSVLNPPGLLETEGNFRRPGWDWGQ
jgi:hypothetical protein